MQGQKGKCKDDTKSNSLDRCEQVERSKMASITTSIYVWNYLWSLDLLAAIQGITLSPNILCAVCSNIRVFHHVLISSLEMFKNRINLYHFRHFWKSWIVTIHIMLDLNKFRQVSTCSDMFENCMHCNNSYHIESKQV